MTPRHLATFSLSFNDRSQAVYRGYFASLSARFNSRSRPSPTTAQVTKDESAYVHLPPTSQPVLFLIKLSFRTPVTRRIPLTYRSVADGSFSGWKRANQVAWPK